MAVLDHGIAFNHPAVTQLPPSITKERIQITHCFRAASMFSAASIFAGLAALATTTSAQVVLCDGNTGPEWEDCE